MRNISDKFTEIIKTHFVFNNFFFLNLVVYEIMLKDNVKGSRALMTIWRMRIACWITATQTHTYTHTHTKAQYTYYFSTATMGARTRLNISIHVHCLSCYYVCLDAASIFLTFIILDISLNICLLSVVISTLLRSRGSVRSTRGLGPTMTARGQIIGISIGMLPQKLIMSITVQKTSEYYTTEFDLEEGF